VDGILPRRPDVDEATLEGDALAILAVIALRRSGEVTTAAAAPAAA
jgi:hypothetical protein